MDNITALKIANGIKLNNPEYVEWINFTSDINLFVAVLNNFGENLLIVINPKNTNLIFSFHVKAINPNKKFIPLSFKIKPLNASLESMMQIYKSDPNTLIEFLLKYLEDEKQIYSFPEEGTAKY